MTVETPYARVKLKPNVHYLVLGDRCPSGQLALPHGPGDIYEIQADGTLSPVGSAASFWPQLKHLGTVDAVGVYLKARK